jgi:cyanophycinase
MIRYGKTSDPSVGRGLGLLQGAVVDQHFSQRDRQTRLVGVLEKHPGLVGLGIDEGTALIVTGNHLRAVGSGRVTLYLGTDGKPASSTYRLSANDEADLVASSPATRGGTVKVGLKRKS